MGSRSSSLRDAFHRAAFARNRLATLERFNVTPHRHAEQFQSDLARARESSVRADMELRLMMREEPRRRARAQRRRERRQAKGTAAAAQLGLFDAPAVAQNAAPPTAAAAPGGRPIGQGFKLTWERLGLTLPDWPEEAPGHVPPELSYAVMCEERRQALADPNWAARPVDVPLTEHVGAELSAHVPWADPAHVEPVRELLMLPRPTCPQQRRAHLVEVPGLRRVSA